MAKRQLACMEERKRRAPNRMSHLERGYLYRDIRRQKKIVFGYDLELIRLEMDDNETEALSSNSVSPLFRRH